MNTTNSNQEIVETMSELQSRQNTELLDMAKRLATDRSLLPSIYKLGITHGKEICIHADRALN